MKRLLLTKIVLIFLTGLVFLSCSDGNIKGKGVAGNATPDTTVKSHSAEGNTVTSRQTNTVNPERDTSLRFKREIRNNGPNQSRIDSIKDSKTKKKK
jgi:hypothetical protein